jgi:hypothetical protein
MGFWRGARFIGYTKSPQQRLVYHGPVQWQRIAPRKFASTVCGCADGRLAAFIRTCLTAAVICNSGEAQKFFLLLNYALPICVDDITEQLGKD